METISPYPRRSAVGPAICSLISPPSDSDVLSSLGITGQTKGISFGSFSTLTSLSTFQHSSSIESLSNEYYILSLTKIYIVYSKINSYNQLKPKLQRIYYDFVIFQNPGPFLLTNKQRKYEEGILLNHFFIDVIHITSAYMPTGETI